MNFIEFEGQLINLDQVSRIHTNKITDLFDELISGESPVEEEYQIVISFTGNSYKNSVKFPFIKKELFEDSFRLLKSLVSESARKGKEIEEMIREYTELKNKKNTN